MLNRRGFGTKLAAATGAFVAACGCGRAMAQSSATPPGEPGGPVAAGDPHSNTSRLLNTGASILQTKAPLSVMNLYLDGFHFYADDMGRPIEAHHYCAQLTEDMHQCVIFDGNDKGSRLIGIEYIISEKLFQQLPEEEKPLWHSHHYEVTSGLLEMPGLPDMVETVAMRGMATTYGKTWHTWHVDRDKELPLGIPQLMMSFTRDGQLDQRVIDERNTKLGVSQQQSRETRKEIQVGAPAAGANAWESGQTPQLKLETMPVRNKR
ncbi:OBAP family protein [Acetobacteraceae bacterium H6797]|nr:OBAP family protein [Acetobacteraceae bacterium H6797]